MNQRLLHLLKPAIRRTIGLAALVVKAKTLGVRVIVEDDEGRVFLVRHSYLPGWYLPGGGVDAGETAAAAALRELREEGGLIGRNPRLFGLYLNRKTSSRDHVALYCLSNAVPAPEGWKPGGEIREVGFFRRDALPQGTTGATRRRLAEVYEAAPIADLW